MKTMTITEFAAHALKAIANVAASREPLLVTKRGRPVVQVLPYAQQRTETVPETWAMPGRLAHLLVFEKDILSPLGTDMWEATR